MKQLHLISCGLKDIPISSKTQSTSLSLSLILESMTSAFEQYTIVYKKPKGRLVKHTLTLPSIRPNRSSCWWWLGHTIPTSGELCWNLLHIDFLSPHSDLWIETFSHHGTKASVITIYETKKKKLACRVINHFLSQGRGYGSRMHHAWALLQQPCSGDFMTWRQTEWVRSYPNL